MKKKLHKGDKIMLPIGRDGSLEAVITEEPHEIKDWQDHYISATAMCSGSKYLISWICDKNGMVPDWDEVATVFDNYGEYLYDYRICF